MVRLRCWRFECSESIGQSMTSSVGIEAGIAGFDAAYSQSGIQASSEFFPSGFAAGGQKAPVWTQLLQASRGQDGLMTPSALF